MWRKRNPLVLLVGVEIGRATVEDSIEVPQKISSTCTLRSSNHSSGYLPKEYENSNLKDVPLCFIMYPYVVFFTCHSYESIPSVHQ